MRDFITKLKPATGFSQVVHLILRLLLPALIFILIRINFFQLALAIVLLSKWRMLAVKPKYWPASIRANGIDILVGLSTVVFMMHTSSSLWQLLWAVAYGGWLVGIKPSSDTLLISSQALIGQLYGLAALFLEWPSAPLWWLVTGSGIVCFLAARHFFDSFDESYSKLLSYTWAYFGAATVWILGHWLLFYGFVAQPTLLLTVIGYGLAALYYLDHKDRLSKLLRREFVLVMVAIIVVVLITLWQSTKRKIV
jgi:hypothetical protein